MVAKLAQDEEEMIANGIDIEPKYIQQMPQKNKNKGILARVAEKMNEQDIQKQDDLTDEALNDPSFNKELKKIQKQITMD